MKKVMLIFASILMAISFIGCGDDGGSGGGGKKASSPDRRDCRYDVQRGQFSYSNGKYCDIEDYHKKNACYNYYFAQHTEYTRSHKWYQKGQWENYGGYFTDKYGNMKNCKLQYLDLHTYFPYRFYLPGQGMVEGCQYWHQSGLIAVPMGRNSYVCVRYSPGQQYPSYQYPQYQNPYWGYGGNYGGLYGGFQLGYDFLLHLNL